MSKNYIHIILIIFYFSCIAHPPDKPDPPYTLLNYLINPSGSNNKTPAPTPNPNQPVSPRGLVTDTGQTLCWDSAGLITACAGTGQDGDYTNTPLARSFTGPTPDQAYNNDYTTMDNAHQRVWKSCIQGFTGNTCGGGVLSSFTWANATGVFAGNCADLNTLNAGNGYANRTDWRIPTVQEMASLVHYSNNPNIDILNFPHTDINNIYMTSTDDSMAPTNIWAVDHFFNNGSKTMTQNKISALSLRCVAGSQPPAFSFQDNSDGTVTDRNTNLLWQKCVNGRSGSVCTVGANAPLNWQNALTNCNNLVLGGRNDWRLPNMNELLSLVDFSAGASPLIQIGAFPNTPGGIHYTSTTFENTTSQAYTIHFGTGMVSEISKGNPMHVRCVANVL
ncbi:DUF1566 domain-containing protein [Leptospira barantonii]|uniref:DUF1566 domain-containing protein n=1 Tax=Leptospira barantonii TaxID=2023184 RepID=A0A5F2AXS8_9LEPT|nr:DUF1566 domain-containing protein [Leptospira barantonii]TGL92932.1 DUF1566 domain-containing protein [Leptospira barantonii]